MNEKIIWDFLFDKIRNSYGVAALMGNLFAESSLNPVLANNVLKKTGLTNEQYTAVADTGINNSFVTDGIAYGLAQWCYHTRKKGLLDKARASNKSVGDINIQLEYLWEELQKYKTVLNALTDAKNVKDASDIVLLKYEKPANTSDGVKAMRARYGQKYYDQYSKIQIKVTKKTAKELLRTMKEK